MPTLPERRYALMNLADTSLPANAPLRRILAALMLAFCLIAPSSLAAQPTSDETPDAQEALTHAWTYYWAGLLGGGDVKSFDRGLAWAKTTETKILAMPADSPERASMQRRLDEVEVTLTHQRRVAAETLRGWFPMAALLRKSLLLNSGALGPYEMIDNPEDVAITRLVEDLRDGVLSKWGAMPQTDVTVVSMLPERGLEDKVLSLLSTTPRINLRPLSDVANTLPPSMIDALKAGRIEEVGGEARDIFGSDRFIVVTIKRVDVIAGVHAMELGAVVFSGGEPTHFSILGVTHDRRDQLPVLILVVFAFGVLGIGIARWLTRERMAWEEFFPLALLSFLGGLLIPNALMGLVGGFEPPQDELVILSFWWPVFISLFLLLGVPIAYTSLIKRFGGSVPWLKRATEFGPQLACATGAGVAAFFARAPIAYTPRTGWLLALLMLGCCIGAARMVSQLRARMTVEPRYMAGAALGLVGVGPAFLSGSVGLTAMCAFVVVLATTRAAAARRALEEEVAQAAHAEPPEELDDASLAELVERARRPNYREFAPCDAALKILDEPMRHLPKPSSGRARWLYLRGQRGSGKTATAEHIIDEMPDEVVVLRGACSPPSSGAASSEAKPFEVFGRAFHGVGMFGLEEPEEDIFSSIEGRVIDAIPIVSMLLPSGGDEDAAVSDRGELYARIVRELVRQTRRGTRRVVLMLDDIQWLDTASEELILHLLGIFGPDSEHPVSFILCGRGLSDDLEASPLARRVLEAHEVCVELGDEARLTLLEDTIGFDARSAELLDEAVTDREGKSNLAWLLTLVEAVAHAGQVVLDGDVYRVTVAAGEELPIPQNFRKMVGRSYDALARDARDLLRVASLLGYSFNLEVLARVVDRPRLDVIMALEEIGETSGMVEDDLSSDDVFKFVSTQRYLALRDHLGVREAPPTEQQSQLLRDLHLRIAQVYEEMLHEARADVADVAAHYWAAGRRDLSKALVYCRQAARAARDVFAFEGAAFQLRRAMTCADLLMKSAAREETRREAASARAAIDLELRLLPYDEAHVLGRHDQRVAQATEAVALFERDVSDGRVDVPLRLLFAMTRACYDARDFDNALTMAEALVDLGSPEARESSERRLTPDDLSIRDMAYVEGLHFIGLSLDPRGQAPERLRWLRRARDAAQDLSPQDDEDRIALKARVYNSLGEQLAQRATYDFEKARDWFHASIDLKRKLSPQDKPGLARAFGGLGRLYLFAARDVSGEDANRRAFLLRKAKGYFEEDIDLCQDYGDLSGECQMHSHLGECALLADDPDAAVGHYARSLELAQSPIARGFALAGLANAHAEREDAQALTECARDVCAMSIDPDISLPPFMREILAGAIDSSLIHEDAIADVARARQHLRGPEDDPSAQEE